MDKRFKIGTRVRTTMGVRLTGVVTKPMALKDCTDGTYRLIKNGVPVRWDDGTQGYSHAVHIAPFDLTNKLRPERFTHMSPKMAAIVGYILGVTFATPALVEIVVLTDDLVLGRRDGDCGMNELLGTFAELRDNWERLLTAAELEPGELSVARELFAQKVRPA